MFQMTSFCVEEERACEERCREMCVFSFVAEVNSMCVCTLFVCIHFWTWTSRIFLPTRLVLLNVLCHEMTFYRALGNMLNTYPTITLSHSHNDDLREFRAGTSELLTFPSARHSSPLLSQPWLRRAAATRQRQRPHVACRRYVVASHETTELLTQHVDACRMVTRHTHTTAARTRPPHRFADRKSDRLSSRRRPVAR